MARTVKHGVPLELMKQVASGQVTYEQAVARLTASEGDALLQACAEWRRLEDTPITAMSSKDITRRHQLRLLLSTPAGRSGDLPPELRSEHHKLTRVAGETSARIPGTRRRGVRIRKAVGRGGLRVPLPAHEAEVAFWAGEPMSTVVADRALWVSRKASSVPPDELAAMRREEHRAAFRASRVGRPYQPAPESLGRGLENSETPRLSRESVGVLLDLVAQHVTDVESACRAMAT